VPSIIVPARNHPQFTATCLGSILYSVSRLNLKCEFILVDDASKPDDNILAIFRSHRANAQGHDCKIVRSNKHQHYSGVFSIGLSQATRDVIFFISNDMVTTPSFFEALLLVSSLSPEIGIVRGTSNYTDSHPEYQVAPPERLKTFADLEGFSRNQFAAHGGSYIEDRILSGDAILLKRSVVERIGVLDLRFFGYFGDLDYGMRTQLAGFKLVCAKGAWLYHEGAGHLKGQMQSPSQEEYGELHKRRMALVDAAYQQFRAKWHVGGQAQWEVNQTTDFIAAAMTNADKVALKYDFPKSAENDLEFY
jgi:GT2 family glycosyltransferase